MANVKAKAGPVHDPVAVLQYPGGSGSNIVSVVGPQKKIKPQAMQLADKRKLNLALPANF